MADIFRKKSLDKLSSPEQLDKMIVINSPLSWLAIVGGGFIIAAVLFWAILGRVPITQEGNGILLGNGTVNSVYAGTQGVVTKTYVSGGDQVSAGDILFDVNSRETAYAKEQLEERIEKVKNVTFTSKNDETTADNQQLITLKNQKLTMSLDGAATEEKLKTLNTEYKSAKKKLKTAKKTLDKAQEAYYGGIADDDSSAIQYEYNKALTEYQTADSLAKTYKSSYMSAQGTVDGYYVQWTNAKAALESAQHELGVGSIELAAMEQNYQVLQTQAQSLSQIYSQAAASASQAAAEAESAEMAAQAAENYAATAPEAEKAQALMKAQAARAAATAASQAAAVEAQNAANAKTQAEQAASNLEQSGAELTGSQSMFSTAAAQISEMESTVTQAYQQYALAANQLSQLNGQYQAAVSDRNAKQSVYDEKKAAYEKYIHNVGPTTSEKTKEGNEYNLALSEYNTQKAAAESLKEQIKSMKLQLSLGNTSEEAQLESLEKQFSSAKQAVIDQLNTELNNYNVLTDGMQIKADNDGVIYTTLVANGSPVSIDTEVARISDNGEAPKLQAIYYMGLDKGKNVKEGMTVNIYASTLPKEEYGHMTGTVTSVASYVSSYADLYARLGDSTLAQSFMKEGSVIEVVCEINQDESTASGYEWSSQKGRTVEITEGTLLTGSVVTEEVPPITMLIPKLKEKFHME